MSLQNYENRVDAALISILLNYPEYRKKFKGHEKILSYSVMKELAEYICSKGEKFDEKVFIEDFGKQMEPGEILQIKYLGVDESSYQIYFKKLYGDHLVRVLQDYNIKLLHNKDNDYQEVRDGLNKILEKESFEDEAIHPDIKRTCREFIEYLQQGQARSFIDYFDSHCGGIPKDCFMILAALSSNGKTSYIISIIRKMIFAGKRVLFFSLEMNEFSILEQIIANITGINTKDMTGELSRAVESRISDGLDQLYTKQNLWIYDKPRSIKDIIDKAKYQREKNKVEYIFIDYLQIIRGDQKNTVERLDYIATELQGLSRSLGIPVICLSQFSRGENADEKPTITKLKGSSTIEQSADIVLLMYNQSMAIDGDRSKRLVNFYIAKNRRGEKDIEYQEIFEPSTRRFYYQGEKQ